MHLLAVFCPLGRSVKRVGVPCPLEDDLSPSLRHASEVAVRVDNAQAETPHDRRPAGGPTREIRDEGGRECTPGGKYTPGYYWDKVLAMWSGAMSGSRSRAATFGRHVQRSRSFVGTGTSPISDKARRTARSAQWEMTVSNWHKQTVNYSASYIRL